MAKLTVELVIPERHVLAEEGVDVVVAPGIDGELAVLPSHAPLVTELSPGVVVLQRGGEEDILAVSGGFLEVLGDTVTVLADTSERSDEIDLERAQAARDRALEAMSLTMTPSEVLEARIRLLRALARIRAARRRSG
ncbi:MAG: F0F1 ATP synthase subunit epsilon [Chloroflexota bacterium]|jgi:F-type H+-transporting ATPase subunit epsilon|nr:F0F1 ATP synthase subunit epsilon [Chloroflexota bacterium]MDP6508225.1 F0F1 ATP synthase subunit epsilon [Chloroflexota bacterium]MDP6757116.1 F0F1 ATP synthase subunit epsilon [Chloroflexota bacterium]